MGSLKEMADSNTQTGRFTKASGEEESDMGAESIPTLMAQNILGCFAETNGVIEE